MKDVVKHEVLQGTQEEDKVVRLYARPDVEVSISEKSSVATIAGSSASALKIPVEKAPWYDHKLPWFDKRPWWGVPTRHWFDDPEQPGFESTGPKDVLQENTVAEQGGGTLESRPEIPDSGQVAVNPQIVRQEAPFVMATPHIALQWKTIE